MPLLPMLAAVMIGAADPNVTPAPPTITQTMQAEAQALQPLMSSDAAKAFLSATSSLPLPEARTLYRSADRVVLTTDQFDALSDEDKTKYKPREYDARFYYLTGYGTPMVYARPLDIAASTPNSPVASLAGKKILDFGYGTIGHLRLLASNGANVHGVEVEPLFKTLYSFPGDAGTIAGVNGAPSGSITLHHGQWPASPELAQSITAAGPFDLFISKNTLKRGYIHPEREADPRTLVHLGVDDDTFIRAMHDVLKPGGLALIYNICPAQAPADKPYIPWADGRCPFDRAALEKAGFEVIVFDQDDAEMLHKVWIAVGLNGKETAEELKASIFAEYTLLRRK